MVRASPARALALALALAALDGSRAAACSSCGCGDPTLTAMGLDLPYQNRVRLALEERFGGHTAGDGADVDRSWTLRSTLLMSWSPIARLTIAASLPLVSDWILTSGQWQSTTMLGDAELSLRGVVFRDRRFAPGHLLSLVAGLKMPTGPRAYFADGIPLDPDDQPGSGSWDPFAGATYVWFRGKWSGFVSASWRYPTPGRDAYQHGQSVGATVGAQLQPWRVVGFGLATDFRWAEADGTLGIAVPNTGGALLALEPSIVVAPVERWLIKVAAQIQVGNWLYGSQTESHAVMLSTIVDLN